MESDLNPIFKTLLSSLIFKSILLEKYKTN